MGEIINLRTMDDYDTDGAGTCKNQTNPQTVSDKTPNGREKTPDDLPKNQAVCEDKQTQTET